MKAISDKGYIICNDGEINWNTYFNYFLDKKVSIYFGNNNSNNIDMWIALPFASLIYYINEEIFSSTIYTINFGFQNIIYLNFNIQLEVDGLV